LQVFIGIWLTVNYGNHLMSRSGLGQGRKK